MQKIIIVIILIVTAISVLAQDKQWSAFDGISTQYEVQVSASHNRTPLWLNANKYGLSSLAESNGYIRAGFTRDLKNDSTRTVGLGYGIDVALPYNYETNLAIQQLYAEVRYKVFTFCLGSKNQPMAFKNQKLSSGGQALGINARSIPQARLSIDDYWTLPYTHDWLAFKGHFSYGFMTDGRWQRDFTKQKNTWAENCLYHSKAGYFKIGKENHPWSFELGLEMATIFGGKVNWFIKNDSIVSFQSGRGLKSFWHAFIPGGSDYHEDVEGYENVEGDHLGSWVLRLNYEHKDFDVRIYADKFFEDHSSLYNLGNYGYGKDGDWKKRNNKYYLYPLKDGLLGIEMTLKRQDYVKTIVVEAIDTRDQSGPIYHDHTSVILDQIGGTDDFYNHRNYTWSYYGQVMGNPLYLSPIYNENGARRVMNNRFFGWHFGIDGYICPRLYYRALASWQKGYGTYLTPYDKPRENSSFLFEAEYDWSRHFKGWHTRLSLGLDKGRLLDNSHGVQITFCYN